MSMGGGPHLVRGRVRFRVRARSGGGGKRGARASGFTGFYGTVSALVGVGKGWKGGCAPRRGGVRGRVNGVRGA